MADDIQSLKDWKAYYKKRYKETGREVYKKKLKELKEELSPYLFKYDPDEVSSKAVLMRADQIVTRIEKLKIKSETEINFKRAMEILNRDDNNMPVTGIQTDRISIQIKFAGDFILDNTKYTWILKTDGPY